MLEGTTPLSDQQEWLFPSFSLPLLLYLQRGVGVFASTMKGHRQQRNASLRPRPPCLWRCIKIMY